MKSAAPFLAAFVAANVHLAQAALVGMWPQPDAGYKETPGSLNAAYGVQFPMFQFSQRIPLRVYNFTTGVGGPIPEAYIEATGTDADIFLTIYPTMGLGNLTDSDILSLALQLRTYQASNRTVFLRWGPEMNGSWMTYGVQPTMFKSVWTRMYNIIKAESPDTVIVWSPNTGYSYPFGMSLDSVPSADDRRALDTNKNGVLDSGDDPYSPYYPGDALVDWIGISMYYKGPMFVNKNQDQPRGFTYDILRGVDPYNNGGDSVDWYKVYCEDKPTKACVISEAAAAWHAQPELVSAGPNTQVQLQRAWWQDNILNQTFLRALPRLRGYLQFEQIKNETDGGVTDLRDYRISNDSAVLSAFKADLAPVSTNYYWANATTPAVVPNTTAFGIVPSGPVLTATVTVNQTSMVTGTYTQFYSGPFVNVSYVATANPLASPTGTLGTASGTAPRVAAAASNTNVSKTSAAISISQSLASWSASVAAGAAVFSLLL